MSDQAAPRATVGLIQLEGPSIWADASLSTDLDCTGGDVIGIIMPESWDDSSHISFQVSSGALGATFHDLYTLDGREVELPFVVPSSMVIVPSHVAPAIGFLRIRSGTRLNPVVQTETREFKVVIRPLKV